MLCEQQKPSVSGSVWTGQISFVIDDRSMFICCTRCGEIGGVLMVFIACVRWVLIAQPVLLIKTQSISNPSPVSLSFSLFIACMYVSVCMLYVCPYVCIDYMYVVGTALFIK